jgi:hypothetical protein
VEADGRKTIYRNVFTPPFWFLRLCARVGGWTYYMLSCAWLGRVCLIGFCRRFGFRDHCIGMKFAQRPRNVATVLRVLWPIIVLRINDVTDVATFSHLYTFSGLMTAVPTSLAPRQLPSCADRRFSSTKRGDLRRSIGKNRAKSRQIELFFITHSFCRF